MKTKIICILIAVLIFAGCKNNQNREISVLKNRVFCVDGSEERRIFYKEIFSFDVNEIGEMFISNSAANRIDAYNQGGEYQYSLGAKGDGPGEFHTGVSVFECTKDKIIVFDKKWKLENERKLTDIGINGHVLKICSFANRPIIYFINKGEYWIAILKDNLEVERLIVTPIKDRWLPVLFRSDIDVDSQGNIYISDNYDYAIHVYDLNEKMIKHFTKNVKKIKIVKSDFIVYDGNEIVQHPASERLKKSVKGDKYWPCICGINIDKQRIFVWSTDLSKNGECLVDVYDIHWNYSHAFYCYNGLAVNVNTIVNDKIYALSVKESYPSGIARQLGKFGKMGMPDQLCVYPVPERVHGNAKNYSVH